MWGIHHAMVRASYFPTSEGYNIHRCKRAGAGADVPIERVNPYNTQV
jgi:hypothetical protein